MTKYNKVYVPDPDGYYEVWNENNGLEDSVDVFLAPPNATIVMTIEELREVWQEVYPAPRYEKQDRLPGFDGYLQSKGINLPQ